MRTVQIISRAADRDVKEALHVIDMVSVPLPANNELGSQTAHKHAMAAIGSMVTDLIAGGVTDITIALTDR